ncbi:MAG: hypothetical protein ACRCSK_03930 [Fusobacteriaceae bacterium]
MLTYESKIMHDEATIGIKYLATFKRGRMGWTKKIFKSFTVD